MDRTSGAARRVALGRLTFASALLVLLCARVAHVAGAEVKLDHTFYHDGDMNGLRYSQPSIDVDADGTVAVAINRSLGPGNSKPSLQESWLVLLYDKSGEPIGRLAGNTTGMVDVAFGPDGRLYTAESWFGSGVHVYDRPGVKPRDVPSRFIRTGGYHPDHGHPRGVAVGPDLLLYSTAAVRGEFQNKLVITQPDGKLVKAVPLPGAPDKVDVAPDGTVYVGNHVLEPAGSWKP
ncbi:hypothetical protein HQ560_13170, partial [bacterium]|nr:hypothetical protein [bacterium]